MSKRSDQYKKVLHKTYEERLQKSESEKERLDKLITSSSLLRMGVFVATLITTYFTYQSLYLLLATLAIGLGVFLLLVVRHEKLLLSRKFTHNLININRLESKALFEHPYELDEGNEFIDPDHAYSHDIDLFGRGSFFQMLNRSITVSGKERLAQMLCENDSKHITHKQAAIKELSEELAWRHEFIAHGKIVEPDVHPSTVLNWLEDATPFVPKNLPLIKNAFGGGTLLIFLLVIFLKIPFSMLVIWFCLGLIITAKFFQSINQLYDRSSKAKDTFKQFSNLIDHLKNLQIDSQGLQTIKNNVTSEGEAVQALKDLTRIIDAFDQRNNLLMGIVINGLFLWDLIQSYRIEQWIKTYGKRVPEWFDCIAEIDALSSLSNFAYNHPDYCYPELSQPDKTLQASDLGHPLIEESKCINNDFSIEKGHFFIITGANMAGKSTFLRTISLSLVMANVGLPVAARTFAYHPIGLITSMRSKDSLDQESSYFHAEITRLKFIVDQMKERPYFIVLDEILKGTNSKDKAIGSKKFVEKLVRSGSTGLIATHDLSLCEIAEEYVQIHNAYFDASIENDELYFDYTLREGICQNMNASFLLKKMDLI